jgi:hypothetical protein
MKLKGIVRLFPLQGALVYRLRLLQSSHLLHQQSCFEWHLDHQGKPKLHRCKLQQHWYLEDN